MFNYTQFIRQLSDLGERQLGQERKARLLIENVLAEHGISYQTQEYEVDIPRYTDWSLVVDGAQIKSQPCGLVSGEIPQSNIISSLISSQKNPYDANINFNPLCPVISKSNHYHAPALAVSRENIDQIIHATEFQAHMNVEHHAHTSANLLVGNTVNPRFVVVSHYDSINSGAVDNASGVGLSLDLVINHSELLTETCIAICGNEEVSFDETLYWGHGYRVLEREYPHIFKDAEQIIVVDSFGYSDIEVILDKQILLLGFPVLGIDSLLEKTRMISGDFQKLMEFYHSNNDVPELIQDRFYQQAKQYCLDILGNHD